MNAFELGINRYGRGSNRISKNSIDVNYINKIAGDFLTAKLGKCVSNECYCCVSSLVLIDDTVYINYENVERDIGGKISKWFSDKEAVCLLAHHGLVSNRSFIFEDGELYFQEDWTAKHNCTNYPFYCRNIQGKRKVTVIVDGVKFTRSEQSAIELGLRSIIDFNRLIKVRGYIFTREDITRMHWLAGRRSEYKRRREEQNVVS